MTLSPDKYIEELESSLKKACEEIERRKKAESYANSRFEMIKNLYEGLPNLAVKLHEAEEKLKHCNER